MKYYIVIIAILIQSIQSDTLPCTWHSDSTGKSIDLRSLIRESGYEIMRLWLLCTLSVTISNHSLYTLSTTYHSILLLITLYY